MFRENGFAFSSGAPPVFNYRERKKKKKTRKGKERKNRLYRAVGRVIFPRALTIRAPRSRVKLYLDGAVFNRRVALRRSFKRAAICKPLNIMPFFTKGERTRRRGRGKEKERTSVRARKYIPARADTLCLDTQADIAQQCCAAVKSHFAK